MDALIEIELMSNQLQTQIKVPTKPLKGPPKNIQEKALELPHDGLEKGVTSGLKSALGAAGVDTKAQEAIEKAVEAAIKEEDQR